MRKYQEEYEEYIQKVYDACLEIYHCKDETKMFCWQKELGLQVDCIKPTGEFVSNSKSVIQHNQKIAEDYLYENLLTYKKYVKRYQQAHSF